MNLSKRTSIWGLSAAILAVPCALHAQSTPLPLKPGLWEMQVNTGGPGTPAGAPAGAPSLPPDAEARIAALPPAQQAQVRAAMAGAYGGGGAAAARPAGLTRQECLAPNTTLESLVNRAPVGGMQCSYSNLVQTAHAASFDLSCTGAMGKAQGRAEYKMLDDEHMSSTIHISLAGSAQTSNGQNMPMNMSRDISSTGKFLKADCGDVKPYTPPAGAK